MWAALAVLACSEPGAEVPVDARPTSASARGEALPAVRYEREQLERSLQLAIEEVGAMSAEPVHTLYRELLDHGDEACPPPGVATPERTAWDGTCTSAAGLALKASSGTTTTERSFEVSLSGTLTAPGRSLSGRGKWKEDQVATADGEVWTTSLGGPALGTGASVAVTWLARGLLTDLRVVRTVPADGSGTAVRVVGELGNLDAPMSAVELDLELGDPDACLEPVGAAGVRVPPGRWFDVAFDGATCDGCGEVSFRGEPVGVACARFDTWAAWRPEAE